MSIRGIYILPASTDTDVPLFSRLFPTVEARCKSLHGQQYIKIPIEKDFIKLLLIEIGLKDSALFNEDRDRCNKEVLSPVFQIETNNGILWPIIVMKHKNLIYSAVIFEDTLNVNQHSNIKLTILASVVSVLDALNGLANFAEENNSLQGSIHAMELLKYISTAFPYGRPVCCDSSVALNFPLGSWKGKVKQPAWNPLPYKGKSSVVISVREEVRSIQFNQKGTGNLLDVYGTVTCTSEIEGVAPDISLVLSNSSENKCYVLVNAYVSNVETITSYSTRLRFHPIKSQTVCLYKMNGIHQPPISGKFSMKVKDDVASIYVNLLLQPNVKNSFQKLEVQIPFPCGVSSIKSQCSQGLLSVNSLNMLLWNVGSKLPTKTREASLRARVKLKQRKKNKSDSSVVDELKLEKDKFALCGTNDEAQCATVVFTILDYVYSGNRIDPQSILVSSTSKVNRVVANECSAGEYKLWNAGNCENIENEIFAEELELILQNS